MTTLAALSGLAIGDETTVELPDLEPGDDGEMVPVEGEEPKRYRLTVVDVLERVVPEVDAERLLEYRIARERRRIKVVELRREAPRPRS